jgi:hypothetical protein
VFACDASLQGGGAHLNLDWMYWSWHSDYPEIESAHINVLELFTVMLSLIRWGEKLAVLIRSDNVCTVSALNKSTSRSTEIMPLVRQIFSLCVKYDIILSGAYIPGKLNVLADRISRLDDVCCVNHARLILANFEVSKIVLCKGHMSKTACVSLQGRWTGISSNY